MSAFEIRFDGVGCRYAIRQGHRAAVHYDALKNISFSLREGERLGVVGANGAGKSTLLKLLAQTLYPTSGRIARLGRPRCALLALQNLWFPDLSGRENAVLACLFSGLRRREAEARLGDIADFAELGPWLDQPVRTYSSGMAARLGLAAALQIRADVLLLDEVLSVGDAGFAQKAAEAVREKMRRAESLVLVSHSLETLDTMCERVLWIKDGALMADGPGGEVIAAYKAEAGFL